MKHFYYTATLYASNEGSHINKKINGLMHSEGNITEDDAKAQLLENNPSWDDVHDLKIQESIYIRSAQSQPLKIKNMITYGDITHGYIPVLLNGIKTGEIHHEKEGWHYIPKGQKTGGDYFEELSDCKKSLED